VSNSLSILVHAASKTGKSTLSSTAPLPLCVLDAEGGWRFIREAGFQTGRSLRKKEWDPIKDTQPPRYDGTWDVCVVTVQKWQTLTSAYQGLTQYEHDFKSLVFDSITEAQRRLKTNLRGMEQFRIQDWGDLLVHMDNLIRSMRDLVLIPGTPLQVVMFIAETKMKEGKWRPQMQGQIGDSLPYWMDIVGYLYRRPILDENGQALGKVAEMLIGQDVQPNIEAGERVQGLLGDYVTEPNISEMLKKIYGEDAIGPLPVTATSGGNA
jgi:hypothetical protein